ncbi:tail protein [Pantoea phage PdC23]|uniref:Tail fiber protein n=1 Tax=Pantoea phage PdC23 TaxID=2894356 RepID=A0AAE9C7H3_9CAUD|nr:tail protein [Pantoea phage PdC23]UGC97737.1 tail fiber protein [Pantoea phage PdC23]
MLLLAANNAKSVLAAGIAATDLSLTVAPGAASLFPVPVSGTSYFMLTIVDALTGTQREVVQVTGVSGSTFTIVRAQEGTTARAWSGNDIVANLFTAGTFNRVAQIDSSGVLNNVTGIGELDTPVDTASGGTGVDNIDDIPDALNLVPFKGLPKDTFLFANFRSQNDVGVYFSTSNNGYQFATLSDSQMKINGSSDTVGGRDPSQLWIDGRLSMGVTAYVIGTYDTTIYRTTDGKNYTRNLVNFGSSPIGSATTPAPGATHACNQIWGPYLFMDGDTLYCGITLPYGADFVDINGNTIPDFRQYIATCTNIETLTFSTPVLITQTGNTQCQIDGVYYKIGSTWHLFTKNDYNKNIEHWTSSTLMGPYTKATNNPITAVQCEAPCLVQRQSSLPKYILYADDYVNASYVYTESADLVTWTAPTNIGTDRTTRHGSVINTSTLDKASQTVIAGMMQPRVPYTFRPQLISATNATFSPRDGWTYYITGTSQYTLTITELGAMSFKILIASQSAQAQVTIAVSTYFDGLPGNQPLILNGAQNGNKVVTFYKLNNKYVCDAPNATSSQLIQLSTITGFPTITQLVPIPGALYGTNGTSTYSSTTTISDVSPNFPDGTNFYLQVRSVTTSPANGTIQLSSSANVNVPSAGVTITPSALRVYEVRKMGGQWQLMT